MKIMENGVSLCLVVSPTIRNIECRRVVAERDPTIPFRSPPGLHELPLA